MVAQAHLWDIDHPYYCTQGNYYARPGEGLHTHYGCWADFLDDWGTSDLDMNLVFRWDWNRFDRAELLDDEEPAPDVLQVFWVLQRKAILRSTSCIVTEDDEPAVRKWLQERAVHLAAVWAPLLPAV